MIKKKVRFFTALILMLVFLKGSIFAPPMVIINAQSGGYEDNDVIYHFEDNAHGFAGGAQRDISRAYKGLSSLKIGNADSDGKAWTGVGDDGGSIPIYPNNKMDIAVFIPEDNQVSVRIYLLCGPNWAEVDLNWSSYDTLNSGEWNIIEFNVPGNIPFPVRWFLIEFYYQFGSQRDPIWIDHIRAKVNKDHLQYIINEAVNLHDSSDEGSEIGQFEEGSKENLAQAIQLAIQVLDSLEINQLEVNSAVAALNRAIDVFMQAKITENAWNILEDLIQTSTHIYENAEVGTNPGYYTQHSKDVFMEAIEMAIAVFQSEHSTRRQILDTIEELQKAIDIFENSKLSLTAPKNPKAIAQDNSIILQWEASDFANYYRIYRSLQAGGPYIVIADDLSGTVFEDNEVQRNLLYYYRVESVRGEMTATSYELNARTLGIYQLRELPLFREQVPAGWASGAELCDRSWFFPIDIDQMYNGLPSLRINITQDGWWGGLLAHQNWQIYSLRNYFENGSLEFHIKGNEGNESFIVGFEDRRGGQKKDIKISDYVTVSTEWKKVSIPLKEMIKADQFDLSSVGGLYFGKDYSSSKNQFKVWLNDIKIISPDHERTYASIKINQLGYTPLAEKYALISGFPDEIDGIGIKEGTPFKIKEVLTGTVFYEGNLKIVTDFEPLISGEKVFEANFSSFKRSGLYYISIEGLEDSYEFWIKEDVYNELLIDVARYFYLQRANIDLLEEYAGPFARAAMHLDDGNAPLRSDMQGAKRDVSKGWYDAGDFGKYVSSGADTVSHLLWAYELYPEIFKDNQFNIPESDNGIPDILDEIRYELEWILKMQDDDGGFYARVWPQNEKDKPRYIDNRVGNEFSSLKPTYDTALAVGVLAHASLIYEQYDYEFAQKMLQRAIKGWEYLELYPNNIEGPYGPYHALNDKEQRFFASAALYRVTGSNKYSDYVLSNYYNFAFLFDDPHNASIAHTGFLHYLKSKNVDLELKGWFEQKFKYWSDEQLSRIQNYVWRNPLEAHRDYYWGSNGATLSRVFVIVAGNKVLKTFNQIIVDAVRRNLNYILGINPLAFSFVSGYGQNAHRNVYSNIYSSDGLDIVPKGYMPGGPNMYEGAWFSRFAGKAYIDSDKDWVTNEHTIYWNAYLLFSIAVVNAEAKTSHYPEDRTEPIYTEHPEPIKNIVRVNLMDIKKGLKNKEEIVEVNAIFDTGPKTQIEISSEVLFAMREKNAAVKLNIGAFKLRLPSNVINQKSLAQTKTFNLEIEKLNKQTLKKSINYLKDIGYNQISEVLNIMAYIVDEEGNKKDIGKFDNKVTAVIALADMRLNEINSKKVGVYSIEENGKIKFCGGKFTKEGIEFSIKNLSNPVNYVVMEYNKIFADINDLALPKQYKQYIEIMASRHITMGKTPDSFVPNSKATRGQIATFIGRAFGFDEEDFNLAFTDLRKDVYYTGYVSSLKKAGIIKGYADGTFRADMQISREEMIKLIMDTYVYVTGTNLKDISGIETVVFEDMHAVSQYAVDSVKAAKVLGIIDGTGNNMFDPKGIVTRAEAAKIIVELLIRTGEL